MTQRNVFNVVCAAFSVKFLTLFAPQNVCEPQNVGFLFDVSENFFSVTVAEIFSGLIVYKYTHTFNYD